MFNSGARVECSLSPHRDYGSSFSQAVFIFLDNDRRAVREAGWSHGESPFS